MQYRHIGILAIALTTASIVSADDASGTRDWPQWRGPSANGVVEGRRLPTHWSTTKNIRWSVKLPGWGTSSPVVRGERIFVTSQTVADGKKSLLTLCYSLRDGKELWRHDFGLGVDQKTHKTSNLAANTPAVTADALYVAFANSDIARYTHDGKLQWVQRYMSLFGDPRMAWGYGVSPLPLTDSILFPWNHHSGPCFLVGLNAKDGAVAWKKERPIGTVHATPLLVEHNGQSDLLVVGQNRLTAFDAKTRKQLWQYGEGEGLYNGEIVGSAVYADGVIYTQLWRESPIHALRLRGNGGPPEVLWVSKKGAGEVPSLLYYRGLVYAVLDKGLVACHDAKDGTELYRERLNAGCYSSPIAAEGFVYISDRDGVTHVLRAGRTFEVVARNELEEQIIASPAIVNDLLIYRTDSRLYCVENSQ